MRIIKKKGVSPLIATVLLVLLVVFLAAIIFAFINNYSKEGLYGGDRTTEDIACSTHVRLELKRISQEPYFCYNETSGDVSLMLENAGNLDVLGFQVSVVGTDSIQNIVDFEQTNILVGEAKTISFNHDISLTGSLVQVIFIPKVVYGRGEEIICSKNPIIFKEYNPNC